MSFMFELFIFAVNATLPLILIIALGYVLKKRGFFTSEFIKLGNKTVFRILLPVFLFTNISSMSSIEQIRVDVALFSVGSVLFMFFIGCLFAQFTKDPQQKGVLLQSCFRSNFALIGVPLAQLIAGDEGVVSAAIISAFVIPTFNILAVIALSLYVESDAHTSLMERIKKIIKGIVKNPLIIGVCLGILTLCLKLYVLPEACVSFFRKLSFISTTLSYIARASTPMALLVLGAQFEMSMVHHLKKQIFLGVFGRLILAPILCMGTALFLHFHGFIYFSAANFSALIALVGTPVAVSSAIMAEEMKNDGQLASQLVVWTTLLSSFVIFFLILLLRGMGCLY